MADIEREAGRAGVLAGAAVGTVMLTLAACSSQAPRVDHPIARNEVPVAAQPQPPAKKPAPKKGGGYYLDDGPGDNPPDLAAVADAVPRLENLRKGVNKPYSVMGQDFVPMTELRPYKARGVASWYGRKFHGQKTANGEVYDMYAMSAAHPTLPIPSYARVSNPANGQSVVVRVNDRGPFLGGRIMDLSYTAAWKLGYADRGSTLVEVELLQPNAAGDFPTGPQLAAAPVVVPVSNRPQIVPTAPRPAGPAAGDDPLGNLIAETEAAARPLPPAVVAPALPEVARGGGLFLQLAAFASRDNAESFKSHLLREVPWLTELRLVPGNGLFRLQAGPYANAADANKAADLIRQAMDVKPMVVR